MANLSASPTAGPTRASAFTRLSGLFAGLCAVFAALVTVADWYDETMRARWPVVSATVERADVALSYRTKSDGGGKLWNLRVHVRYDADGGGRTATLTSRTVYSEEQAATLRSWAAQYRKGSHIEIRYDPSRQDRAVATSSEGPLAANRTRTDLILLVFAAIASAALLKLAKVLSAREARAAPIADSGQGGGPGIGLLFAAMGLMIMGLALYRAIEAAPFTADSLMALPAGLMFVFGGILIGLPPQYQSWRSWLATLVVTCFAITFDWVAFGPGERHFTGSINGIGFVPGETMGRFFFGAIAVLLDICAVGMWIGQLRQASAPSASAAKPADSTI
jgi:Protein of unknown function (DUF3592)